MPTHNTYRYTIGLVCEGIGSDTSKSGGQAWAYGPAPTGSTNYEWMENHLIGLPESIDTTVNPLSGDFSISAFDFELHNNNEVATTFLHQSTEPQYKLSTAITASGTTVTVLDLAGTAVTSLSGSAIWVGDECIKLGTHSTAGQYPSSTRGFWDTEATAHIADTYVHTSQNYWRFRGVKLILHDRDTDTERTLWRGWIDSTDTNSDGSVLQLSCQEVLSSLAGATVNRDARSITTTEDARVFLQTTGNVVNIVGGVYKFTGRVRKASGSSYRTYLQLGEALAPYNYGVTSQIASPAGAALWDSVDPSDFDQGREPDEVFEVLVVDSDLTAANNSTGDLTLPWHPLEIAMSLLTSTRSDTITVSSTSWDALNGEFALGIPLSFFDTSAISTLITATKDLKIKRLLLGWGGEPVDVLSVIIEKLLKPYGFYFAITEDGLVSFDRLELFNILEYDTASGYSVEALPPQLQWSSARSNAVQRVEAEVGGLPWRDPDVVSEIGRDNTLTDSLRGAVAGEKNVYQIDFSTQETIADVQAITQDRLKYAFWAMPRLSITVDDSAVSGATYDIGAVISPIINTQSGWLVDRTGARVAATGSSQVDSQFAGIIVGRRLNIADMTYSLTLLLTNYRQGGAVYLRAPSGVVSSQSTTDITLEANTFHSSDRDASKFNAGDEVEFYRPDGVLREAGFVIDIVEGAAGNNVIRLLSTPTLVATGDIMRLADYDTYSNTAVTPGGNAYNYQADATGKLGAANDDGRRWA